VRVLLDENVPVAFAPLLTGHHVDTVAGLGWQGVKNGELMARATGRFEALVTMDRNLKDQQPLTKQAFGVILIRAPSNRMVHLTPLVALTLAALEGLAPGEIRRVGA
jgi:hypothetical protein